ncbi:hypothetical protein [Virgibacillus sp. L01]
MSAPLRQAMGLDLKVLDHIITFTEEVVVGVIGAIFVVFATIKFSNAES